MGYPREIATWRTLRPACCTVVARTLRIRMAQRSKRFADGLGKVRLSPRLANRI
ncbi:hypothetical protein HEP75_04315 [Xanthomonas sp. SI]|nr:hypothetical protein HEP75_04315 [Xanthomonas sp. SI]